MSSLLKTKRVVWGLMCLLLTAISVLSYASGKRYLAASRAVEQAILVQQAIDGTLSLLKDAETGQRGFMLTGAEQFLEPHRSAVASLPRQLAELEHVTVGDPLHTVRMKRLERLIQDKLAFIDEAIRVRRDGDLPAAMALVRSERGKQLMDAIRSECRAMSQREQAELGLRRQRADTAQTVAAWGVGVGSILTVLLALLSFLTLNRDVKTLQATAEELAASEEHFRLLTENTSDLVRLLDLNGKSTYVSPSVERLLGYTPAELLALPAKALMHPDDLATAGEILGEVSAGVVSAGVSTYRLRHKSGVFRYFEVRWSVQKDSHGAPCAIHTSGRDVTERKQTEALLAAQAEQLRSLSLRDELTQLYNRRGFLEVASQAQAQAVRDARALGLIFIDLNGMKRINDELGHEAGDHALIDTARVLQRALRESDVIARLGGDEFAAFAVDFTSSDLDRLRARLRELADDETARRDRPYRLSMSLGGSFAAAGTRKTLAELLEQADAAMYEQKRARQAAGNVSVPPPADREEA
jgi:two-component system, cell cycle response regulator